MGTWSVGISPGDNNLYWSQHAQKRFKEVKETHNYWLDNFKSR